MLESNRQTPTIVSLLSLAATCFAFEKGRRIRWRSADDGQMLFTDRATSHHQPHRKFRAVVLAERCSSTTGQIRTWHSAKLAIIQRLICFQTNEIWMYWLRMYRLRVYRNVQTLGAHWAQTLSDSEFPDSESEPDIERRKMFTNCSELSLH